MASIPILAAVAAAIIVPVAGTGIYYSVRPATHKEETNEEPIRRLKDSRLHDHGRVMGDSMPGSKLLQIDRIAARGGSAEQFETRAKQERDEARASINELLENGGSLNLDSSFPETFRTPRVNWASSHSSTRTGRP